MYHAEMYKKFFYSFFVLLILLFNVTMMLASSVKVEKPFSSKPHGKENLKSPFPQKSKVLSKDELKSSPIQQWVKSNSADKIAADCTKYQNFQSNVANRA